MQMAMAISSKFSNISLSSYSTKSHSPLPQTHSSSNYTCSAVQQDTFLLPSGGTLQLSGAASATTRILERESEVEWHHESCADEATIRSKRRRRRRRKIISTLERTYNADEEEDDDDEDDVGSVLINKKAGKSRFMTPTEEARFSRYLKERARVEAVRRGLVAENDEDEVSSNEWAKAAGISRRKLDKILWNGRESEKIINQCYHGLVLSIASSYLGRGLTLQDLAQEGSIGLLRGAIKFDPQRGYKLSTYAYWWIRQSITRAVAKKSKLIRLPGSISELIPKICEANKSLGRELRRFPTYLEIAEAMDANSESVRLAIERNRSPISLDQAMTSHGYMCLQVIHTKLVEHSRRYWMNISFDLQDIIPGPCELTPEAMMKKETVKPEIGKLLEALCEREAHIVRLHYGLNGETLRSFEEIGRLLKLSRERVRQINSAALMKLREASQEDHLKYFI